MQFEWDTNKAAANFKKHGVSFTEAATAFGDPLSVTFPDPEHSVGESRYITTGLSSYGRLLVLAHTDVGSRIRIISARKTTPKERKDYEEGS